MKTRKEWKHSYPIFLSMSKTDTYIDGFSTQATSFNARNYKTALAQKRDEPHLFVCLFVCLPSFVVRPVIPHS